MNTEGSNMVPVDSVFVRHGRSEINEATDRMRKHGDASALELIKGVHTSEICLTSEGREQAIAAGEWLRREFKEPFDRFNVSPYARALETAGLLALPGARWHQYIDLCERDWGTSESLSPEEYTAMRARMERDSVWGRPANGSTLHDKMIHTKIHLNSMAKSHGKERIVSVNHGEVMWTFRYHYERMTPAMFQALDESKNPFDRINNCQILHYTRRNPHTNVEEDRYNWMRSVCPWDESRSSNDWQKIVRPSFSNEELLELVRGKPRFLA